MAEDYMITVRSEGLLGQIGQWGAALVTDEELLEALAAHDAEVREHARHEFCDARLGCVVAEEPEWEYGIKCPPMDVAWLGTRESVEATLARWADSGAPLSEGQGVFRRIKQGPWVPVKQEGEER